MEFDHYDYVPQLQADKIIAAAKALMTGEEEEENRRAFAPAGRLMHYSWPGTAWAAAAILIGAPDCVACAPGQNRQRRAFPSAVHGILKDAQVLSALSPSYTPRLLRTALDHSSPLFRRREQPLQRRPDFGHAQGST